MKPLKLPKIIPAAVAAVIFPSAISAEPAPTYLWKMLAVGDTAEIVAEKLSADSAFKSIKVKRSSNPKKEPSLSIKYASDGINVLDLSFQLAPIFERGRLRKVALQSAPGCAHHAPDQFRKMAAILHEKYPKSPVEFGVSDDDMVRKARREGTDESPAIAGRVFQGGGVTVTYQQTFTAETAPPVGYVGNPKMAALLSLMANQYEYRARECDGTGNHRMTHTLIYMSDEDFGAMHEGIVHDYEAEKRAAKDNL